MESLTEKEQKLYEEAEARVNFKSHLRIYVIINILIWVFWFVTRAIFGNYDGYWPIYATLGWGFGVFSHYMGVYKNNSDSVQKEYQKLKQKRGI